MARSNRKALSRTTKIGLGVGGGLIVVLVGAYAAGYALAGDNLPRNAEISGVKVGGLSTAAAEAALRDELAPKAEATLTIRAANQSVTTTGTAAGLGIDYSASIAQAGGGRSLNPIAIAEVLFGGRSQRAVVTVDQPKLDAVVSSLATKAEVAPVDAKLAYEGLEPKTTPGADGTALPRDEVADAVVAAFLIETSVTADVAKVAPAVTTTEADHVLTSVAKPAVAATISVEVGGKGTITIKPEVIAQTLTFSAVDGTLKPTFDAKALNKSVAADLNRLGLKQPKDASFTIKRGGKPQIVPSSDGLGIDATELSSALVGVIAKPGDRSVSVAVAARPAEFTTAEAKKAGVKQVTGSFTTYFPGTAYRYNNIGKAARLINGTYLAPGETFSMNETLGERTVAAGWMAGGAIDGGQIVQRLGGGISQATTTTFNAIFFAGLEDIYHKPHSLYFNRYPVGREATLDWVSVDMKFKNDSPHGVLMQAWITGSTGSQGSVTVRVWSTKRYTIKTTTPVRGNYRSPGATKYDSSPGCLPQSAMSGFDVSFYRLFYEGKQQVKKEKFAWSYNSLTPVVCGKKPK
ncbi:MAG: VanW family protein [Propionicimonas sp.]